MTKFKNLLTFVVLAVMVMVAAGCQRTPAPTPPGPSPTPVEPVRMDVAVYYIKTTPTEMYLIREVHQVDKTAEVAKAALNELISGTPTTAGASRVLPAGTRILGINIDKELATVDFSTEVLQANVGSSGEALGIASIVNTLTEFPTIKKVAFMVEGSKEKGMDWWGHVGLYEQPFQRDVSHVFEPAIWVTSPVKDQVITSPVKISGSARVFEATVSFRLRDSSGMVIAQGHTMASEGAPGRGDYSAELAFTASGPSQGQIEVFEASAKDGSDINKVIIPVQWQ
ncbi:MAG: Gmad2 immunoglobulin-like domain-containing protein [Syntrophomonadaceae bacterium]